MFYFYVRTCKGCGVHGWFGECYVLPAIAASHYLQQEGATSGKQATTVRMVIWGASLWCIWRTRNNLAFDQEILIVQKLEQDILFY